MKILFLLFCFLFIIIYSYAQEQSGNSICTYYSLADSSEAQLKLVIDNDKSILLYLGKIPSIVVDKNKKTVNIEILTDKPFKRSHLDSLLFKILPFYTVTISYNIVNEIKREELQKDGYDMGYLLSPNGHGVMAILLFKSRQKSNIYDVVLMPNTEEGIDITSNFLVIEDCQ